MVAKRVREDGITRLSVNGEVYSPVAFMTYYPNERNFRQFREAGVKFFSFGAYASDYGINDYAGMHQLNPHFWVSEGEYDFAEIDRVLELIAPGGEGGFIFPRVYVECPKWWAARNPDELCLDNRGDALHQSFASDKWRRDAGEALRALIDHVNASKWRECVVGYHIAAGGTEEWTYCHHSDQQYRLDYSEPNRRAYVAWLERKYGTAEALSRAWKREVPSFEAVSFPTLAERLYATDGVLRDPGREMPAIDFWDYTSWSFADTILYFCRVVKEYSAGNLLTGAFYGYVAMLTRSEKGHYALGEVLASPDIDFIATTNGGSEPGQSWPFGSAVESVLLHGKLFFAEGDVRTCLSRTMGETLPHAVSRNNYYKGPAWRPLPSLELSLSVLKKACLRVLTGQSGVWWFDMFGGWFDSPEMMELFARFRRMVDRQSAGPLKAEMAVIIDEGGLKQLSRDHTPAAEVLGAQRMQLSWCGAPTHTYLAEDLADDSFPVNDYKLYLLLDLVRPSERVRRAIREKLQGGGRVLLWSYLSDVDGGGALTDFPIVYDRRLPPMRGVYRSERYAEETYPSAPLSCPRFAPGADEGAYQLAAFEGSQEPCALYRQMADYASVYSLLPALPASLISDCLLLSNAHIYNRTGDVVYAGGRFLGLHARAEGEKRIYLPFPIARMRDAETGEEMHLHNGSFTDFNMRQYETRIFEIDAE